MQIQEDESGSDPESYSNESDLTVDNELLYHGRRYDTESNLYYYRARYYDPILGRFLSTDPMGYKDSMNLYQAFNMNGMNFVDPMGEYFVVPEKDRYKDRILRAIAIGSLTNEGSPMFWRLFNDSRPIKIYSGDLPTTLKPKDLFRKMRNLKVKQTYGIVDPNKALKNWTEKRRVDDLEVKISYNNLDNYFKLKKRFGYVFINQGNVDREGITTLFHELIHASDFFNLDPSFDFIGAFSKVREGDFEANESGEITERKYSHDKSRAQRFGEKVYNQSLLIRDKNFEKQISERISLILKRMNIEGNEND